MNLPNVSRKIKPALKEWISYLGVTVEILVRMENCSLIRWRDRVLLMG